MTLSPDVTVLVATFNRANCLSQALDSLLAQTVPAHQIIVINDGSTDETASILESYGDRIQVITQPNGGKSNALNGAMPHVTGDYIWVFDDDDIALPNSIELHRAALASNPNADFTYGTGYVVDVGEDGIHRRKRLKALPEIPQTGEGDQTFQLLLDFNFMPQQAVLAKRHCYEKVGPYDEDLHASHDYDMMLRLTNRFGCHRVTTPTFIYVQHAWLRGVAQDRYGRSEREIRWLRDDRKVVARYHSELSLKDYSSHKGSSRELTLLETRQALLKRMSFAARRGLWDLARDDLEAACKMEPAVPLSNPERSICQAALGSYLGRPVAMDCLMADGEMSRRIADLAYIGCASGQPGPAAEILSLWAQVFVDAAKDPDDEGRSRQALAFAGRLDPATQTQRTVAETLQQKQP